MDRRPIGAFAAFVVAVVFATALSGCGGDGGPNPPPPEAPGRTTFRGNLARTAVLQPQQADAQDTGVQVCIEQTTFCSSTDDSGEFVLVAPVSGNISLLFGGVDFTARLMLSGVPMDAVVTIRNIECSTSSGRCTPQQLDIEAPMPTSLPLVNQSPVCLSAVASPSVLFPPNHQLVAVSIVGVSDPDGDAVTITPTSVAQDEPVLGTGSGDTEPDATPSPLALRAERSGQGNGRVYTVSFVADDGRGGSCTGTVQVCVPHDQRTGGACIDDGPVFDSTR